MAETEIGNCAGNQLSLTNKPRYFYDFMEEVVPKFTGENVKAMKRFMRDVISMKIDAKCQTARELFEELTRRNCINEYDVDLLEDLLGVAGRSDILNILNGFKKKCPVVPEFISPEAVEKTVVGKLFTALTLRKFNQFIKKYSLRHRNLYLPCKKNKNAENIVLRFDS